MERKLEIYTSTLFNGMFRELKATRNAILEAGHFPAGLSKIKQKSNLEQDYKRERSLKSLIKESDIFILIIDFDFYNGNNTNIGSFSCTVEEEYLYAKRLGLPIFIFVLSNRYLRSNGHYRVRENDYGLEQHTETYLRFKNTLLDEQVITIVDSLRELERSVFESLMMAPKYLSFDGWIKADSNELAKENKRLKKELENNMLKLSTVVPQTSRPPLQDLKAYLGMFTYEEILYALTSRSVALNSSEMKEFNTSNRNVTLLEILITNHSLLTTGIMSKKNDRLNQLLMTYLIPILISLGLIYIKERALESLPNDLYRLTSNGHVLIGKIYCGTIQGIEI